MDDGRNGQVSIDVKDTFYDLLIIWSGWKQFICHWSSQCLTTRWCNYSLLKGVRIKGVRIKGVRIKGVRIICDCQESLGLCIPLIATSETFSCGSGSNTKFEGSSPHKLVTTIEEINAAILDKYICATAATIQKQCKAFLLADGGNFEHFLTSM